MDYREVKIDVGSGEQRDIIIALLSDSGFESFIEEKETLLAYIPASLFDKAKIKSLLGKFNLSCQFLSIPEQNWNVEWEKHYDPVLISDKCFIRAPFHPPLEGYKFEIVIEPKMSFGTGHHETTVLMIEMMMEMEFTGKRVLDMGCGTGILAILARKLGAAGVVAVDNDDWSYRNTLENIGRNKSDLIRVESGDVKVIANDRFDLVLANINRNVLLKDLKDYSRLMTAGELVLSGFYKEDIPAIMEKAEKYNFRFLTMKTKNNWVAIKFRK